MTPDEALTRTVAEVAPEVRRGRLKSVALTEASIRKLETVGRQLGSVASLAVGQSLEEAQRADREIAAGHYRGRSTGSRTAPRTSSPPAASRPPGARLR